MSRPDQLIVDLVRELDDWVHPVDGVAVAALTWLLSPPETRVRNTVEVGLSHWYLHTIIDPDAGDQ